MKKRRLETIRLPYTFKGFDCSLSRYDIKSALEKHFASCGDISRVFVPFECRTGVPLGCAYINLMDPKKALTLDGSYLGPSKLEVVISGTTPIGFYNFKGCGRCILILKRRNFRRFVDTRVGRVTPWYNIS
ncbi:hypothetical protein CARUB_v10028183mg [Capsella rubella]|uniref:RRM domain-containing protein n=1 Tax=Capsella rubella TaxID=81985 RepID=R0GNG8_9BRAS|nr:hypothetical protein CARUB_v10028183mg [Capsella rubella]